MVIDTHNDEASKQENSYDEFKTHDQAEKGRVLHLHTPLGVKTSHWLKIRSKLSHVYEKAKAEVGQKMMRDLTKGRHFVDQVEDDIQLIASLVKDWSFKEPCTRDEVIKFLKHAPQFKDEIEEAASDVKAFFEKKVK